MCSSLSHIRWSAVKCGEMILRCNTLTRPCFGSAQYDYVTAGWRARTWRHSWVKLRAFLNALDLEAISCGRSPDVIVWRRWVIVWPVCGVSLLIAVLSWKLLISWRSSSTAIWQNESARPKTPSKQNCWDQILLLVSRPFRVKISSHCRLLVQGCEVDF